MRRGPRLLGGLFVCKGHLFQRAIVITFRLTGPVSVLFTSTIRLKYINTITSYSINYTAVLVSFCQGDTINIKEGKMRSRCIPAEKEFHQV